MIPGSATAQGTVQYSTRFPDIDYSELGATTWRVSPAGFGGYRVSADVDDHVLAMTQAITRGINLIDTSTNYTDGASERLVGRVLGTLVSEGLLARDQVVVVSKLGYIQGQTLAMSERRNTEGQPFPDRVPYSKQLEHCIHPEFITDQLEHSLERLQLETLDVLLLHNPEYYLGWAARQGMRPEAAQNEFYRRIRIAFDYLENEVQRGRIQAYGISSNTLVSSSDDPEFVSLTRVREIAANLGPDHHFRVIQLPMNLFEPGAVLERNQINGQSVLTVARHHKLGVLVNRPLNAFDGNSLIRLSDPEPTGRHTDDDVIRAIGALTKSETTLWRKLLPGLSLPTPLYRRIKEQAAVADQLKHYWRNFGTWDRWCQVRDGFLKPHVQGVMNYLGQVEDPSGAIDRWLTGHRRFLDRALKAVGSLYIAQAEKSAGRIRQGVTAADPDWAEAGTLSRQAIRAIRSTAGISSVLVGMRQSAYVDDVLKEVSHPVPVADRSASWHRLQEAL